MKEKSKKEKPNQNKQGLERPDREKRKRSRPRRKTKAGLMTYEEGRRVLLYKRLGIFGIAALVFAGIFYMVWSTKDEGQTAEEVAANLEVGQDSFKMILEKGDMAAMFKESATRQQAVATAPLPDKLRLLQERVQLAERIEEVALENGDREAADVAIESGIDALVLLDALNQIHELNDSSYAKRLREVAEPYLDSDRNSLKSKAHIAMSQALVQEFMFNGSDEKYAQLEARVNESLPYLSADPGTAVTFSKMLELLYVNTQNDKILMLHRNVGDEFRKSDNEVIWLTGTRIHERLLIGQTNFDSLRNLITIPDESAIEELTRLARNVAQTRIGSTRVYLELIESCESLTQVGRSELANQLLGELSASAPTITDEATCGQVELMFDMLRKRQQLPGTAFEIKGQSTSGSSLEQLFSGQPTMVVFFSMVDEDSRSSVLAVKDLIHLKENGARFLVCCQDQDRNQAEFDRMVDLLPEVTFANQESSIELQKRCPLSYVPYKLVLDKDHKVVDLNPNNDQTRMKIERLLF